MSNLWLNPALLRPASDAQSFTTVRADGPENPGRVASATQDRGSCDVERAARREIRTSLRRLCLRLVAVALLGGSAAFSYVAWSDDVRAGLARSASTTTLHGAREDVRTPNETDELVREIHRENIILRERIARLERAIGAVGDRR